MHLPPVHSPLNAGWQTGSRSEPKLGSGFCLVYFFDLSHVYFTLDQGELL